MLERYKYIFNIALEAVFLNKFRSVLTALGIIFGVAAVITMMAIGNGARQVILEQMKMVGVNNILIMAKTEKGRNGSSSSETKSGKGENKEDEKSKGQYSPGLNLLDAEAIKSMIPTVEHVSPEVIFQTDVITNGIRTEVTLTGVTPAFFRVYNLELIDGGMFNEEQLIDGKPVCIIGPTLKSKFFPTEDAIGKDIKCGPIWLKVIGVLKKNDVSQSSIENLGISDYNNSVYAPIQTLLRRYKDRSLVTASMIRGNNNYEEQQEFRGPEVGAESENNNSQVDKIVVQVRESSQIGATTDILTRMMKRRHAGVEDVEIKVPELLLKQEQHTKDIFNIVLGAIASISLLIGGIGIMNIMLASVMERIKEIGIRQAIGATKRDVVLQFLMEATLLSVSGGVIGILLGLALSKIIMEITGILTIVSILSIVISFGVSASVGIIFGYMPSRQAAMHDPVESLRHD